MSPISCSSPACLSWTLGYLALSSGSNCWNTAWATSSGATTERSIDAATVLTRLPFLTVNRARDIAAFNFSHGLERYPLSGLAAHPGLQQIIDRIARASRVLHENPQLGAVPPDFVNLRAAEGISDLRGKGFGIKSEVSRLGLQPDFELRLPCRKTVPDVAYALDPGQKAPAVPCWARSSRSASLENSLSSKPPGEFFRSRELDLSCPFRPTGALAPLAGECRERRHPAGPRRGSVRQTSLPTRRWR